MILAGFEEVQVIEKGVPVLLIPRVAPLAIRNLQQLTGEDLSDGLYVVHFMSPSLSWQNTE